MRKFTIATAALLLAACQQPTQSDNAALVEANVGVPATSTSIAPEETPSPGAAPVAPESVATPLPSPVPVPSPSPGVSPTPTDAVAFPPRFRGRWGLTVADCDPKRADNKGLMRIEATTIRFYESRGTASSLDRAKPGTIVAKLAMNGEGQAWIDTTRFTLRDDGKTLVRASDQGGGPLRYAKCG